MSIALAIAVVVADAACAGVDLEVHQGSGFLWLANVERSSGRPGSGAEAIRSVMEIADEHGLPLRGAVVRDHDILIPYYTSLGLEPVGRSDGEEKIIIEYAP